MSKLEQLIEELCPNGVEYVQLNIVLDYEQPTKYIVADTNYNDSFETPVLTAGQSFILGYTDETNGIYIATKDNPTIIFDDFTTSFHWVDFYFKIKSSAMKMLRVKPDKKKDVSFRYVYHCMKNIKFEPVDHSRHWIAKYSVFTIPLPPLPVQSEIVRILDNFTELTAELTDRKKQYEYYRDSLLAFGEEVEWKLLEKCVLKTTNIKWSDNKDKSFQYIDLSSVNREDNKIYETQMIHSENAPSRAQQVVNSGDVIFGTTRPMLKRYCLVPGEYNNQICSTGFCVLRANPKLVLAKWIFYNITTSDFSSYVEKNQKGASYPAITDKEVKGYKIPIPSLREQQRIVNLLDQFDTLCNDISKGLPAEISERQVQYEYYRDKLLTFKKINVEV